MRILGIDPGHTVGYAGIVDSQIIVTGSLHGELWVNSGLPSIFSLINPNLVVIEGTPTRNPDPLTLTIYRMSIDWLHLKQIKIITTYPGTWKPIASKEKPYWEPHTRDAVGLARYGQNRG